MRREGERRSIVIFFWASGPHPTSPVSPIVLHHNGGRLIILKTADYQSGRFQGPTSKQSQQYRTEREFLQQFGPLQIKKDPKPTQPAISFYTNPRTHWKCHCCSGPAVMSGGGGGGWGVRAEWDAYQESLASSWKEKWSTCWGFFFFRLRKHGEVPSLQQ